MKQERKQENEQNHSWHSEDSGVFARLLRFPTTFDWQKEQKQKQNLEKFWKLCPSHSLTARCSEKRIRCFDGTGSSAHSHSSVIEGRTGWRESANVSTSFLAFSALLTSMRLYVLPKIAFVTYQITDIFMSKNPRIHKREDIRRVVFGFVRLGNVWVEMWDDNGHGCWSAHKWSQLFEGEAKRGVKIVQKRKRLTDSKPPVILLHPMPEEHKLHVFACAQFRYISSLTGPDSGREPGTRDENFRRGNLFFFFLSLEPPFSGDDTWNWGRKRRERRTTGRWKKQKESARFKTCWHCKSMLLIRKIPRERQKDNEKNEKWMRSERILEMFSYFSSIFKTAEKKEQTEE